MTMLRLRGPRPAAPRTGRAATGALFALFAPFTLALLTSGCANLQTPGTRSASPQAQPAAAAAAESALPPTPATGDAGDAGDAGVGTSTGAASPNDAAPQASAATLDQAARRRWLDPADEPEKSDLWQRVRDGFALPDLDDPLVHKWEQWYASQPDYVQRMTERGGRYLFYVLEEVQRRKMPSELALLPFIESAFNPQAVSRTSASGMWQFMPATGKDFELRQNLFRDDRRDVLVSTRAALDYLQQLYERFGDWQLALAAYNWGPGNVQRAVDRNRLLGQPADFESLQRMPQETREYLPKLQAVKNIIRDPQAFGLVLPPLENHPYFVSVPIERDIDVDLAAKLAGLDLESFRQLNPQLNKPVILAAGTPQVLLPYDNANRFLHALAEHNGALASWTAWVAPRTLKPSEVARLTGMPEARLREMNQIPPRMLVKVGSTLLVPRAAHVSEDVSAPVADHATIALAPEGRPLRRVHHKVGRKGETVASVARRYKLPAQDVARWNDVSPGARFKPGQTVVVMLAPAPTRQRHSSRHATRHAANKVLRHATRQTPTVQASARKAPARRVATRTPPKGHAHGTAKPPGNTQLAEAQH